MTSAWFGDGDADSTIVDNVFYVPNNELITERVRKVEGAVVSLFFVAFSMPDAGAKRQSQQKQKRF